ncbi:hypothetical protein WG66_007447, partial [Moniliophthora roreri]
LVLKHPSCTHRLLHFFHLLHCLPFDISLSSHLGLKVISRHLYWRESSFPRSRYFLVLAHSESTCYEKEGYPTGSAFVGRWSVRLLGLLVH